MHNKTTYEKTRYKDLTTKNYARSNELAYLKTTTNGSRIKRSRNLTPYLWHVKNYVKVN